MVQKFQYPESVIDTYMSLTDQLYRYVYPISVAKYSAAFMGIVRLLRNNSLVPDQSRFISAFRWAKTPEGYEFWEEINNLCSSTKPIKSIVNESPQDTRELI